MIAAATARWPIPSPLPINRDSAWSAPHRPLSLRSLARTSGKNYGRVIKRDRDVGQHPELGYRGGLRLVTLNRPHRLTRKRGPELLEV